MKTSGPAADVSVLISCSINPVAAVGLHLNEAEPLLLIEVLMAVVPVNTPTSIPLVLD